MNSETNTLACQFDNLLQGHGSNGFVVRQNDAKIHSPSSRELWRVVRRRLASGIARSHTLWRTVHDGAIGDGHSSCGSSGEERRRGFGFRSRFLFDFSGLFWIKGEMPSISTSKQRCDMVNSFSFWICPRPSDAHSGGSRRNYLLGGIAPADCRNWGKSVW